MSYINKVNLSMQLLVATDNTNKEELEQKLAKFFAETNIQFASTIDNVVVDEEILDLYEVSKEQESSDSGIYWQKCNQIHQWFVKNIQNGIDDKEDYSVSIEKLELLLNTCKDVINNPSLAKELLPTMSGFFFGRIEYGDEYFQDLEDTIIQLEPIVKNKTGNFYYSANW